MDGSKFYDILFRKGSVSRECIWGKKKEPSEDRITIEVHWKWYGGTLTVDDGEDFDIETVSLNKNSEWKKYEFEEGEDFYDIEAFFEPENDEYEDLFNEEGLEGIEEKLLEEGYELIGDKMVFDEGEIDINKV